MKTYFGNLATIRIFDNVRDVMVEVMTEDYGSPSAKHRKGMETEWYMRQTTANIAKTLKVKNEEILFTSGGIESSSMVLTGTAMASRRVGKRIISARIKHTSVYDPLAFLRQQGFEVTYLSVDHKGHISLEEPERSVRPDTILMSIMYVNNEMGVIGPVDEIAVPIHRRNPDTPFHADAIQAYGKLVIRPAEQDIGLLNIGARKIHGSKGIDLLYIVPEVKMRPLLCGGGQQKGIRSDTEDIPGIAGMGAAAGEMYADHQVRMDYIAGLRDYMIHGMERLKGVTVNSLRGGESIPQITSTSFKGVRSEILFHALEDRGIYVSSSSTCSSNHPTINGVLKAIRVRKELLDSTLGFNFGMLNTIEEVDCCIGVLEEILPTLRGYR